MPLSEQEQKLLDEMERSLYHNDADFVSAVGAGRGRLSYSSLVLGVLLAIVGLAVVIVGVVIHIPLVGILGFAVMFTGVLVALRPTKSLGRLRGGGSASGANGPGASGATGSRRGTANRAGFMDRLNDRWDDRNDKNE
ncbi:hypothetical protein B7R54_07820 [Subtercola boreus]|uniref:DUF3040 domain-containing protein n=1 Tax=Subtercola boreus TaxID=120213 RepID=A0A3E0VGS8_9MICO|nr:DUF3040 domain-containing protein [Subtercola boreus]RFA09144.1 hypothetical protein B7R54_07820 [Subtercola boreus]TQL53844.1 DUF3040 family protein [Subtercola boreus]